MTREENKVYLQNGIARLKAELARHIQVGRITEGNAKDPAIRACKSELARNEQSLAWLQNRIDTSL